MMPSDRRAEYGPRWLAVLAAVSLAAPAMAQDGRPGVSPRPLRDPAVVRTQDAAPPIPAAPADVPISPPAPTLPGDIGATGAPGLPATGTTAELEAPADLNVPAADRGLGGGAPTLETAEEEAAAASDEPVRLMDLLGFEDSPIKIYGWLQNSYTGNMNGDSGGINFGVTPNYKANQWMGNQYYIVVENPLEIEDEINFGFRFDNMFGNDWQFNYMQGYLNNQFKLNSFRGYDLAQAYGEVHLPWFTEGGLDVKVGRWYTIAGYEQVPAIARPLLSVPYMFFFGQPFTHTGVLTTFRLTDKINIYNGAINGWDRWFNENYQWGYIGGFSWTGNEDKTTLAFTAVWGPNQYPRFLPADQQLYTTGYINVPSLAGQPNPGYGANDRTLFTTVLTHKWSDKLTQVMETDQGWEQNVPGLASGGINGDAKSEQWYSFGNWFLWQMAPKLTGVWRSEVFWDQQGGRTSFTQIVGGQPNFRGDRYYEMTLGLIYKPIPNIWIRPEVRYDWAQFTTPYDGGTRDDQVTLGIDAIVLF